MRTLNGMVEQLVREHLRTNSAALSARPNLRTRLLRYALSPRVLWRFLALYLAIDVAALAAELLMSPAMALPSPSSVQTAALVGALPGVAITAQTGVLAIIALAIALVSLVVQRDEAGADVQIYYHESLAFETTASSLALVAVLSVQTVWPLQTALDALIGEGGRPSFELPLAFVHLAWLALNVVAGWHFVVVTLRFVQRTTRAEMR